MKRTENTASISSSTTTVGMQSSSPFFHPSSSASRRKRRQQQHKEVGGDGGDDHVVLLSSSSEENTSTIGGCAFNLTNVIVGSGIVGIPYAMKMTGFILGVILILLCAIFTVKSLQMLIETAKLVRTSTYETVSEAAFGIWGHRIVATCMFFLAYGTMVTYLMIIKDTFGEALLGVVVLNNNHYEEDYDDDEDQERTQLFVRRCSLLVISVAIILPVSCQRDMADLASTSSLSVIFDVFMVLSIAYLSPWTVHDVLRLTGLGGLFGIDDKAGGPDGDDDDDLLVNVSSSSIVLSNIDDAVSSSLSSSSSTASNDVNFSTLFVGLGVMSFAFVCQHSAFIIAGSLENPTAERWSRATSISLSACSILVLCCGFAGYIGYGEDTQGDVLENLDRSSSWANAARIMLGITMLFTYPMESFVARHVLITLLFEGREAHEGNDDSAILDRVDRRIGLTVALYIMAVIPALLFEDVGNVLALAGTVGSSLLAYIGPGVVYLGVHGGSFVQLVDDGRLSRWRGRCKHIDNDHEGGEVAKETTSLLSSSSSLPSPKNTMMSNGDRDSIRVASDSDSERMAMSTTHRLEDVFYCFIWYLTCMPVWYSIARIGQAGVQRHAQEMALKSPHPIRIGQVEYRRRRQAEDNDDDDDDDVEPRPPKHLVLMAGELSLSSSAAASVAARELASNAVQTPAKAMDSKISMNRQIGKDILRRQQELLQRVAPDGEDEEAISAPGWIDFIIAIFFILFGCISFIAGILSLL